MDAPVATFVDSYLEHVGFPPSPRNQSRVLETLMIYPKFAAPGEDRIHFLDRLIRNFPDSDLAQ